MRLLVLFACLCLAACGREETRGGAPDPESPRAARERAWVDVPGLPWAKVTQAQVDAAARMGVPPAFENQWGMRFVYIPAGAFEQGSPATEPGRGDDEALHEVRIRVGFFLQTEALRPEQEGRHPAGRVRATFDYEGEYVDDVGQELASAFAVDLSEDDPVWNYRLPTEAEWEYACRAGVTAAWSWGNAVPEDLEPHRVNAWGLKDMHLGIREWCLDRYGEYPTWTVVDPTGPKEGKRYVTRGACRASGQRPARSAQRTSDAWTETRSDIGFRLAIPLGYGLGKYGSVPVTFRMTHPQEKHTVIPEKNDYDLRFIRMNDRLAARTQGTDPVWERVARPGSPVTLKMVPGKYYVYAESKRDGKLARGLEIKFHVWEGPSEVAVPIPEADMKRYGSGGSEKPQ